MPGIGGPTVPSLTFSGGLTVADAAGLRHPPELADRDPDRVEELEHLDRRRRGADVDGDGLVEPERAAQVRRTSPRRRRRRPRRSPRAPPRPPARAAPSGSRPRGPAGPGSRCSLGQVGDHRLEAGLELLPDPRHGEEPGRAHLRQEVDDLARVGADRDRRALDHRQVVVRAALGDVGGRQPGDHLAALVGEGDQVLDAADEAQQVAVRQLDALRRPGRARGVDQGQQVVELDARRRSRRRRSRGRAPRAPRASWSPPSPSTTITCSRSGRSALALSKTSRNGFSTIATLAPASPTTYGICSGEEVW